MRASFKEGAIFHKCSGRGVDVYVDYHRARYATRRSCFALLYVIEGVLLKLKRGYQTCPLAFSPALRFSADAIDMHDMFVCGTLA